MKIILEKFRCLTWNVCTNIFIPITFIVNVNFYENSCYLNFIYICCNVILLCNKEQESYCSIGLRKGSNFHRKMTNFTEERVLQLKLLYAHLSKKRDPGNQRKSGVNEINNRLRFVKEINHSRCFPIYKQSIKREEFIENDNQPDGWSRVRGAEEHRKLVS